MCLDLAARIAYGKVQWASNDIFTENRKVLYILAEDVDLVPRVMMIKQRYGHTDNLAFPNPEVINLAQIDTDDGLRSFKMLLDEFRPGLTFIDTFAMYTAGATNDGKDMKNLMQSMRPLLSEYETTIAFVHHSGWAKENRGRIMGAQELFGNSDFSIHVDPANGEDDQGNVIPLSRGVITSTKVRGAPAQVSIPYEIKSFKIDGQSLDNGEPLTAPMIHYSSKQEVEEQGLSKDVGCQIFETAVAMFGTNYEADDNDSTKTKRLFVSRESMIEAAKKICTGKTDKAINNMFNPGKSGPINKTLRDGHLERLGDKGFVANKKFETKIVTDDKHFTNPQKDVKEQLTNGENHTPKDGLDR